MMAYYEKIEEKKNLVEKMKQIAVELKNDR